MSETITEAELKAFLKNEEKLCDLAAMTVAASLANQFSLEGLEEATKLIKIAERSYALAAILMTVRRQFLKNDL